MSPYFWFACGGGVLTSLALGWLHRHDLADLWRAIKIEWRIQAIQAEIDALPPLESMRAQDLFRPYPRPVNPSVRLSALPELLEHERARVLAFDRQRLLDDGVLGVQLSKRVH